MSVFQKVLPDSVGFSTRANAIEDTLVADVSKNSSFLSIIVVRESTGPLTPTVGEPAGKGATDPSRELIDALKRWEATAALSFKQLFGLSVTSVRARSL